MHTLKRTFVVDCPPQNKTDEILDDINRSILDVISTDSSSSISSEFVNEMCDTVRKVHANYPEIKFESDKYWSSPVSAVGLVDLGIMAFLEEFLINLEEEEKMRVMIKNYHENCKSLRKIYRIIDSCSPALQSYNIAGLLFFAQLNPKDFRLYLEYWFVVERVGFDSVQSLNWLEHLRARIFLFPFIVSYLVKFVPGQDICALITKALESTYLIENFLPKTHGFTSYDLKIYIEMKSGSEELIMGATFVTFLHEMINWLSRISAQRLIDSRRVKSADPNNPKSSGEGGFDFETYLFGSPLAWINAPAASYLLTKTDFAWLNPDNTEEAKLNLFRKEFKRLNKSRECSYITLSRGGFYCELGGCAHMRLYRDR